MRDRIVFRGFGTVDLRSAGGDEILSVLAQPKRIALLAYLAFAVPRPFHARDTVLALLWPELDQARARAALSKAIHYLRRALGAGAVVTRGDDAVGLDWNVVWCDGQAFESAIDAGALERAVDLYAGPLLDGFYVTGVPAWEHWLERERSRLSGRAHGALLKLAAESEAAGRLDAAIEWTRRALGIREGDEPTVRRLIALLDNAGDRAGALREYERFAGVLSAELDSDPAPETRTLIAAVRARLEADARGGDTLHQRAASLSPRLVAPLDAARQTRGPRKSVLVVDFTNISGVAGMDWLSAGIAETVSTDLKRVGDIRVVGTDADTRRRLEAERAHGPLDGARAVALGVSLGARWVVWGGFQIAGDRIRLTPHFADTETGAVISAQKTDGPIADIFALQDQIVGRLADILRIRLSDGERAGIARPETNNLEAYESFVKGLRAFHIFGIESARVADECFRRAIALDPGYAQAHAWLGSLLMPRYIATGNADVLDEGVAALERAMRLDPGYGAPYVFLAYMYARQQRYADSIRAACSAIEREPSGAFGWYLLGCGHMIGALETGALDELPKCVPPFLRARSLQPGWHPPQQMLAAAYALRGQHDHAVAMLDEVSGAGSRGAATVFIGWEVQRAAVHVNSGEPDQARALIATALATYPTLDHVYADAMTAFAYFVNGVCAERYGDPGAAEAEFRGGLDIAAAKPHRLSIGAHWVKSAAGLARVLWRSGRCDEARSVLREAMDVFEARSRFLWRYFLGASDAEVRYEIASALATLGERASALAMLTRAAEDGWADDHQIARDPAFDAVRQDADVQRLMARSRERVHMAAPVGPGGMPSD